MYRLFSPEWGGFGYGLWAYGATGELHPRSLGEFVVATSFRLLPPPGCELGAKIAELPVEILMTSSEKKATRSPESQAPGARRPLGDTPPPREAAMQANGQQQPLLGQLPTTIEMALLPSTESRVITEPEEPFRILHVNDVWCHVCGYDAEEVIGETCAVLQGPGTCRATLGMLKQALNFKRNFAVQLLNYTKQGKPFMNTLQVTPLVDSQGRVTHYLGVVIARSLDGTGVPMSVSDPTTNPCKPDALHHRSERPKELTMKAAEPSHSLAPQQRHEMPQYPTGGENSGQSRRVQQKLEPQPSAFENGNMSLELLERGDDAGGASTRVPPFLTKLYEILTAESADIVAFNPGVASFTIQNPSVFAKEVLPRYFKHNKLGSFSQQLHTYGFRRRANASSLDASIEFSHDQYTGPPANQRS